MEFSIRYGGLKDEKEHILFKIRGWNTNNCNFLNIYASAYPQTTYNPNQNGSDVNWSVLKYVYKVFYSLLGPRGWKIAHFTPRYGSKYQKLQFS